MNRFGVSDACYHELTQIFPDILHSYRVKRQCQSQDHFLEDGWHRVVEPYDGMYCSFKDKLLEVIVSGNILNSKQISN